MGGWSGLCGPDRGISLDSEDQEQRGAEQAERCDSFSPIPGDLFKIV